MLLETDPMLVNGVEDHAEDPVDDATDGDTGDDSTGSATASSEDEEKGTQEAKNEKQDSKEKDSDLYLIHDTGFNIKVEAPGIEPFDLPVSKHLLLV